MYNRPFTWQYPWRPEAPLGKTRSPGEGTCSHTHVNVHSHNRTPCARLLPSAAQPPTNRTTRRPTGPTTDATPGPQAGAMLDRDLQPLTSALEGGWPPVPQRGLTPSVRWGSVCRDNRGAVRREWENLGGLHGRQWKDHKGVKDSHGMGGQGYRTMGEGHRMMMRQKGSAEPLLRLCLPP